MEGCSSEDSIKSQQFSSEVAGKRSGNESKDDSTSVRKRVKLRGLQSGISSHGMTDTDPASLKINDEIQIETFEKELSQCTGESLNVNPGSLYEKRFRNKSSALEADHNTGLKLLVHNGEACIDKTSTCEETVAETIDAAKNIPNAKCEAIKDNNNIKAVCYRGNLNEDASSSVCKAQLRPSGKDLSGMNPKDTWECGSSTGPLDNMSMKKWAEMKQNGFLTPNYGSTQAAPKQRGRKSKAEVLKRKMEQAKKEQVDRFAKIAAPSGLLNGLNPGIINHVRNSKHVHSIIQALVNERGERDKGLENADSWIQQSGMHHCNASQNIVVSVSRCTPDHVMPNRADVLPREEHKLGHEDFCDTEGGMYGDSNVDPFSMKLSLSAMIGSQNASSLAMEDPFNAENVDSLSVKAANIAFHWLQLLCHDMKGRLSALKHSKSRVQEVISRELPFLLHKELLSKDGNDVTRKATAELHRTRWMILFNKMEQGLFEEEQQLESQLNQVNKMLEHCGKGLEYVQHSSKASGLPLPKTTEKRSRSGSEDAEGELAVKSAAASIYSTCSFALSMANVKCR